MACFFHFCMLCGLECCAEPVCLIHACSLLQLECWCLCMTVHPGKPNSLYSALLEATTAPGHSCLNVFFLKGFPFQVPCYFLSGDVQNSTLAQGLRSQTQISGKILKFSAFQSPIKKMCEGYIHWIHWCHWCCSAWGSQRPEDHQEMLIPICTFRKMEMTYLVSLDEAVAARSWMIWGIQFKA